MILASTKTHDAAFEVYMKAIHELETERLKIRRFRADELDAAAALMDACFGAEPREVRAQWLDWQVSTYEAFEALCQLPYGDYAVEDAAGALVGSIGLVQSFGPFGALACLGGDSGARNRPEVGLFWATAPEHRRQGYALEAARGMCAFAFDALGVGRLVATTEDDNAGSIAVMRALGMTVEVAPEHTPGWFQVVGVLEAARWVNGQGVTRSKEE
jgi:RimJ/RimL family protein N-acetyltransferase